MIAEYNYQRQFEALKRSKVAYMPSQLGLVIVNVRRDINKIKSLHDEYGEDAAAQAIDMFMGSLCSYIIKGSKVGRKGLLVDENYRTYAYSRQVLQYAVRSIYNSGINFIPKYYSDELDWFKSILGTYKCWSDIYLSRTIARFGQSPEYALKYMPNENGIQAIEDYNQQIDELYMDHYSHNFLLYPLAELKYFAMKTVKDTSAVDRLFKIGNLKKWFPTQDIEHGFDISYAETERRSLAGELVGHNYISGKGVELPTEYVRPEEYRLKTNSQAYSTEDSINVVADIKPTTQDDTDGGQGC